MAPLIISDRHELSHTLEPPRFPLHWAAAGALERRDGARKGPRGEPGLNRSAYWLQPPPFGSIEIPLSQKVCVEPLGSISTRPSAVVVVSASGSMKAVAVAQRPSGSIELPLSHEAPRKAKSWLSRCEGLKPWADERSAASREP